MTKKQWAIVALITLSALALVNARYHERRLYAQMERVERQTQKLSADIEALQVELTSLRHPGKIDAAARRDLKMVPIKPTETQFFSAPRTLPAGNTP